MLDYLRITLYLLLALVCFLLFQTWQKEHPVQENVVVSEINLPSGHYLPEVRADGPSSVAAHKNAASLPQPNLPVDTTSKTVKVTTDLFEINIDTRGGDITEVKLLKYPESLGSRAPFLLLNNSPKTRYLAESGLLSNEGPDTSSEQALYTSSQDVYILGPSDDALTVGLRWQKDGLEITKFFIFARDSYEIKVGYEIHNQSHAIWEGNLYTQLLRTDQPPPNQASGMVNLATYFGAAVSTPEKPFEKVPFKEMREKNFNKTVANGWVAMIQHYFISAWIPPEHALSNYYSRATADGLYTIGMIGEKQTVLPGATKRTEAKLYVGPASADQLEKTAKGLKLTIDYGWFWFISAIIFWMMQEIYKVVGNWGWSIVLVTIVIKLLFYQLSAKSYRSMSALKNLQPRIERLKEKFGDDRQKLTQATLELYRQEKVNPMSGCLPILVQIPVFIALYWVLVESVQLRQAPFILWIKDLSQHDPYYVLPVLMGLSMFIQQRLNPPPPDPMQAKVMMLMPFIFTALFANFPAGLMLYWFVNNTLSFLQQWHIMHAINKKV